VQNSHAIQNKNRIIPENIFGILILNSFAKEMREEDYITMDLV